MKIVIAPDKFKHSLTSLEACLAIEEGLIKASKDFKITILPLADGGDGLSEIVKYYIPSKKHVVLVHDPLFRQIDSFITLSKNKSIAFIEMAKASGLLLLKPEEYNCMYTTTFGTGELIKEALKLKVKHIIIGIGGSATNDCGIGMASALGYRFLDKEGAELKPIGQNLANIERIDSSNVINFMGVTIEVACDVKNQLTGANGAARIYARQKGASDKDIEYLESGMMHFAEILKKELDRDVNIIEGAGAAGGLGAGCMAFLNAKLISGIELALKISAAEKHIKTADLVITGEGRIDSQSLNGKVLWGISQSCAKHKAPLIAFCGDLQLSIEQLNNANVMQAYCINSNGIKQGDKFKFAYQLLSDAAFKTAKSIFKKYHM